MFRILVITATLLAAASAAHADVYRITDAQGRVQYTDRWEPGAVLIKGSSSNPGAPKTPAQAQSIQERLAASNAAIAQQQAQAQTEQAVKADVAKSKAEQCKQATEAYNKAIQARRIFREGKNGQREYITDAEADAYRAEMLTARKESCGK